MIKWMVKTFYCRILDVHKWQTLYGGRSHILRCVICGKRKWL